MTWQAHSMTSSCLLAASPSLSLSRSLPLSLSLCFSLCLPLSFLAHSLFPKPNRGTSFLADMPNVPGFTNPPTPVECVDGNPQLALPFKFPVQADGFSGDHFWGKNAGCPTPSDFPVFWVLEFLKSVRGRVPHGGKNLYSQHDPGCLGGMMVWRCWIWLVWGLGRGKCSDDLRNCSNWTKSVFLRTPHLYRTVAAKHPQHCCAV